MRRISHFYDVLFGLLLLFSTSGGAAGHLGGRRGLRKVAQEGETQPTDYGFTEGTASSYQASMNNHFIPTGGVGSTEEVGMVENAFNRTEGLAGAEDVDLETETFGVLPSGDPVSVPGGARVSGAYPARPLPVGETPTKPEAVPPQTLTTEIVPIQTRPSEPAATQENSKPAPLTTMEEELFRPTKPVAVQGFAGGREPATLPLADVVAPPPHGQNPPVETKRGQAAPAQASAPESNSAAVSATVPAQVPPPEPTPAQTLPPGPAALPQEIATEPVPAPVTPVRMEGDQSPRLPPRPTPAQIPPPLPAPLTRGLPTYPSPHQELPSLPTERIFSGGIPPETAPSQGIPTEAALGGIVGLPSQLEGHPFASPPPFLPEPAVEERPEESAQDSNGLCDLHPGEDYVSNESGEGVSVAGVADCCERCQMGADCVAFAFYTSGLCFLKHQTGQLMPNPLMTAGIMLRNGVKATFHPVSEADSLAKQDWVTAPQQVAESAEPHKGGGGGWVLAAPLVIVAAAGVFLVSRRFYNPRFFGRGWRPLQETEMGMLTGR